MMTDPIADMLTRIRNASAIERPAVEMPASQYKTNIANVLKDEGFIIDYQVGQYSDTPEGRVFDANAPADSPKLVLRLYLKYGPEGEKVVRHLERVSKPGRRVYVGYQDLKPVLDGLGIAVISTSKGVMSDRRARAEKLGGELLCHVW